jgi:uncharacterized protein YeeX (DUF496 family)
MEQAGSIMETIWKRNYIVGFYFSILLVLLLCVITTPLLIRHGISITDHLMVEEEVLETVLILALFGISFLILIRFTNRLKAYQQAVNRAVHDKSKLVSRLTEAFRYIGRVNVEIQEIESVLCGVAFYPQSKREFRRLVDRLALRAMTIAAAPWLVVRMVDRHSGQTVNEHAVGHPGCAFLDHYGQPGASGRASGSTGCRRSAPPAQSRPADGFHPSNAYYFKRENRSSHSYPQPDRNALHPA